MRLLNVSFFLLIAATEKWYRAVESRQNHPPLRGRVLKLDLSHSDAKRHEMVTTKSKLNEELSDRKLTADAFFGGATVSGGYKYEYKVSEQQVVTAAPITPAPVVPGTPVTAVPVEPPTPVVPAFPPTPPVTSGQPFPVAFIPTTSPPVVAPPMAPTAKSAGPSLSPAPPITAAPSRTAVVAPAPTSSAPVPSPVSVNPVNVTVPSTTAPVSVNPAAVTVPSTPAPTAIAPTLPTAPSAPTALAPTMVTSLPTATKGPSSSGHYPHSPSTSSSNSKSSSSKSSKSKASKAPTPPKLSKSSKATSKSLGGKGNSSKSLKGGKGSSSKGSPKSSKGGSKGGGSKDGPAERDEYEYEGSLPRTLPVSAFLYVTSNANRPGKDEYEQVALQTQYLLDTVYRNAYNDEPSVEYMGTEISESEALATRLIKFDVNVHFQQDRQIPSLWEVQSIAESAVGPSGSYLTLYLDLLRNLEEAPVFSTTTFVQFISNAEILTATEDEAQDQDEDLYGGKASIVAIVVSLVVSCLLIAGSVYYYYNYYHLKANHQRNTTILEGANAIEVKRESSSVNGDQTSRESSQDEDADDSCAESSSYEEVEVVEESDYDEITLEDEDVVDYKKHVGEIKKSYVATNVTEVNLRGKDASGAASRDSTPIRAYPVDSPSVLNPVGHPYSGKSTLSPGTVVPLLSATAVQVVPSSRPNSPPPIWSNPNLRPVQPKVEQNKDIRAMARRADDGDNRSLLSIDSQSSATPEFLKKFKEMGLAANPRPPIQVPLNPPPPIVRRSLDCNGDEQSIVTIDSQNSATPEFLKKFKEMGLKRYKS